MNKKSDVDILIEQCIQDTKNEYLEEGFVDNIKAGFNGAKEWLKADARNSFKLRNKNDMKNDRRWSARKGKVSSYAKSIANTLQDYKKSGGTLGRGMKVDDVISRLNQVAQGKYPRGKAQNSPQNQPAQEQPQQTQQKPSVQNQKQQVSGQKPTQPSNNTASQNKMLNSIGGNVPKENNNQQLTPQQNNKQQPSETGNIPKAKGPSFKEKAGNVLSTGAKKVKNTLAKGTQKVKDTVAKGYNNLKDKVSAAKNKKIQNSSLNSAPARQQVSPGGRPMRDAKARVVGNDNADESSNQRALPAPATPSTPQSQATKQPSKKVLSPSEKAKKAIAKAQADVQKAKAKAPKLNVPNAGKPVKRRTIVNAKQRKDIDAATKEMEDFHRSLGDTGAEWEERIHESYHGSNTRGQVSMLNSIR